MEILLRLNKVQTGECVSPEPPTESYAELRNTIVADIAKTYAMPSQHIYSDSSNYSSAKVRYESLYDEWRLRK